MKSFLKKSICFLFFVIACNNLLTVFGKNKIDTITETGYIKVSTNAEFEPFEYKDGDKIVGIDIDVAKKVAENLNAKLEINDVSFDAVTLELANGNCDFAIAAMSYSDDKAESVDFSDVYYTSKQIIIVPNYSNIKSKADLQGKNIGVSLGYSGDIYCTENLINSEIHRYNKSSDAISDLISCRIDAIVVDDAPAERLTKIFDNKVKMLDETLFEEGYRIAVPKGEKELLNHINQTINNLKTSGEIDKIISKYTNTSDNSNSNIISQIYRNLKYKNRYKMIIQGLCATLKITLVAFILGIAIGLVIALIKVNKNNNWFLKILKFLANTYITLIRGTPVVVQLFVIYYLILAPTGLSKIAIAMIVFGINSGAYVAENIRSGILSVDNGQYEAGISLGMSEKTTMAKIILPQALKNVFPMLVSEFIQLVKETSVAGFIGVTDLSRASDIIRSQTYEPLVPLLTVALIYLVIVTSATLFMSFAERRIRKSDKR